MTRREKRRHSFFFYAEIGQKNCRKICCPKVEQWVCPSTNGEGELLALTPADFDFEKSTLRINKSWNNLSLD